MKEQLLLNIQNVFNQTIIKNEDSEDIKKNKKETSTRILFNIFLNLTSFSEESQRLTFLNFENIPEIYADIVSAAKNPNCSCRKKVFDYFSIHIETIQNILLNILNNDFFPEFFLQNTFKVIESLANNINSDKNFQGDMAGKIFEINDNNQDYFNLIDKIKKSQGYYTGLSLIKIDNKLKIFFH